MEIRYFWVIFKHCAIHVTSQLRFLLKKKAHHLSTRSNQLIHFFASSEENPYFSFETMLWCSTMTNVSMYQVAKSLFAKLHLVKNPVTRQEMLDLLFFLKTFFTIFLQVPVETSMATG